ncbi:mitochondrial fission ELM1 family protein [Roseiarcaceae bacterium H3SJ34-1]|uniref:mitochondrial fission ELM1 family protein n=1 Tax=Terripilifer ovatus TaxID=3032367 RepID=UPI003AB9A03E|nr:mitochondrial fission ELM1 family protein [Roseiarcaceae bacterium H3SJ34-1]
MVIDLNNAVTGDGLLPPDTRILVLGSGRIGHEVNARGVANALGVASEFVSVRPRKVFEFAAPWGPADFADAVRPPWPDIAIASGRVTVPYLRAIKSGSRGRTFTLFLQDPRAWRGSADLIWVPEHDSLRGPNVLTTLTSPHSFNSEALMGARAAVDPRLASLPQPRVAMVLGGDSGAHRFEAKDIEAMAAIARDIVLSGRGLMVTPSRRTPPALTQAIRSAVAGHAFVWDGSGDNPYVQILANAEAIVVTGDSVNMVGEACATGAPVHVYEPSGGSPKITRFIDGLIAAGAARRWSGQLQDWRYVPIDATREIAEEAVRRYLAHRASFGWA